MVRIFTQWTLFLRIHQRLYLCGTRGVIWLLILLFFEQQGSLTERQGNKTLFVSRTFPLVLCPLCLLEQSTTQRPRISRGGVDVQLHSFFNLDCSWGGQPTSRPGRFTTRKDPVSFVQEARCSQDGSGRVRKISPYRVSIPGPSSPQRVTIPTELSRSSIYTCVCMCVCVCV